MRNSGRTALNSLAYARHFGLLTVGIVVVAGTGSWRPAMGLMASYGVYGALHATLLAVSVREAGSRWHRPCFVAAGALLCMLNVALTLRLALMLNGVGSMGGALLLAAAAGGGAAAYTVLFGRFFAIHVAPRTVMSIALGCSAATLAVFVSPWRASAGGFAVAAAWWIALSTGLWWHDAVRRKTSDERNLS